MPFTVDQRPKEDFGAGLSPALSPQAWGPKMLKSERNIFESWMFSWLQIYSSYCMTHLHVVLGLKSHLLYIKNGHTDVCLFVRPSVGMWRANGIPNPYTDLDEIFHAHPNLSKEGFGPGLTPACSPLGPGGLETLKAEGHILKMFSRLQISPCSARYLS